MTYSVDGSAYIVWVPALGTTPNFLYYSCNGEEGAESGAVTFAEKSASVRCCDGVCVLPMFCDTLQAFNNTWNKVLQFTIGALL